MPFFLIAWGQQYIDSGLAAILNASAPLFTALFALSLDRSQRVTGLRLAGVLLGFAGVVLLVGFELGGGERAVVGGLAVVAASAPATGSAASTRAAASTASLPPSSPSGRSLWATLFTLAARGRAGELPAGRRSSPCSTSASPPPAPPTSSTSA